MTQQRRKELEDELELLSKRIHKIEWLLMEEQFPDDEDIDNVPLCLLANNTFIDENQRKVYRVKNGIYRAKRKDNGEWVQGRLINDNIINTYEIARTPKGIALLSIDVLYEVLPDTVEQLTENTGFIEEIN